MTRPSAFRALLAVCVVAAPALPRPLAAQEAGRYADSIAVADSVVVAAGRGFGTGALRRLVLGAHHRELWNTELKVPVLDLASFAGGLTPYREGGGAQTYSLRFRGGDGRRYVFRLLDKDPTRRWSDDLRRSAAAGVVRDQMSALHPAAALVVASLLRTAGVLHAPPQLVWMPDDPALGEWRERYGRQVGLLEERPTEGSDSVPGFAGADRVEDSEELFDELRDSGRHYVDPHELLAARLMDLFVGDWDRHPDNWVWAGYDDGLRRRWRPVPRDRDWALSRLDGLALMLVRRYDPRHVSFGAEYGSMHGLTLSAQAIDRRLLSGLERGAWDSVAAALQSRLTDSAIAEAVDQLPPELYGLSGPALETALRRRRDALPDAAAEFYRLLATEVAIYGTEEVDRVTVRHADAFTDVAVDSETPRGTVSILRRRFHHAETRELRFYLFEGADELRVTGTGRDLPRLRVVGGAGHDRIADSTGGGRLRLYDEADGYVASPEVPVTTAPFEDYRYTEEHRIPPRDWGSWYQYPVLFGSAPDVGLFLGAGVVRYGYGFRQRPHASRVAVSAGYAMGASTFRAELDGEWRYSHAPARIRLLARASGIEVIRFHGLGNETAIAAPDAFYRVARPQYTVAPSLVVPIAGSREAQDEGRGWLLSAGPVLRYAGSGIESGRFLDLARPYGSEAFGQIGARAQLEVETRDRPAAPRRGVRLAAGGSVYPAVWDVEDVFGEIHADVGAALTAASLPLLPTLVLRAGGKQVWGRYPFHEAAFVGGASTVRGLREQRYAGDAAAWGSAELRLRLASAVVLVPAEVGVLGLADVGRVWLDGERSDEWHTGAGGGVWIALLDRAAALSVALARGEDRTGLYIVAGTGF